MRRISNADHTVILRHVPKVATLAMSASGRDLRAYNAARMLLRTWNRLVRNEARRQKQSTIKKNSANGNQT